LLFSIAEFRLNFNLRAMTERSAPKLTYWPFLLADLVFLGLAYLIVQLGHRPLQLLEMYGLILCVGAGVWCFLIPFRSKLKIAESENLVSAAEQIKNLDLVAAQISSATTLWQGVQEEAAKSSAAAKQVAEQMTVEAQAFSEFLAKANDTEKGHLRLEVDKLRRSEGEWLQILVYILDHVYALHQGALRSRQKALTEQVGNFQNACRDAARRVGIVPIEAGAGEPFDPARHQLMEGEAMTETSSISETLAVGYSFQGQLVRPAVVRLQNSIAGGSEEKPASEPEPQPQLQL
jgi:molecular chaperone GrpE (heat shock protein)